MCFVYFVVFGNVTAFVLRKVWPMGTSFPQRGFCHVLLLMGWNNNTSKSSLMPNVYKNEQEIRVTGFYGRLYLLPRSHCNSSVRLGLSVMLSRAQNQKQKRGYRPTRRTKTFGISEDFDALLSWTAFRTDRHKFFGQKQRESTSFNRITLTHLRSISSRIFFSCLGDNWGP